MGSEWDQKGLEWDETATGWTGWRIGRVNRLMCHGRLKICRFLVIMGGATNVTGWCMKEEESYRRIAQLLRAVMHCEGRSLAGKFVGSIGGLHRHCSSTDASSARDRRSDIVSQRIHHLTATIQVPQHHPLQSDRQGQGQTRGHAQCENMFAHLVVHTDTKTPLSLAVAAVKLTPSENRPVSLSLSPTRPSPRPDKSSKGPAQLQLAHVPIHLFASLAVVRQRQADMARAHQRIQVNKSYRGGGWFGGMYFGKVPVNGPEISVVYPTLPTKV